MTIIKCLLLSEVVKPSVYLNSSKIHFPALHRIGWQVPIPTATMYIWAKLPQPFTDSIRFCTELVEATGVAVSPGAGFGKSGEGYVRFALVHEPQILEAAVARMAEFLKG